MKTLSARAPARRLALLAALALGAPLPASAAPDTAPPHARMLAANAMARSGHHTEALAIYTRLAAEPDAIDDRAGLLGNMGHCLARLGRPRDALEAFDDALDAARDDETRATLRAVIARLEATAFGALIVDCDVAEARLRRRDEPPSAGPLPCPATLTRLDPGPLTIVGEGPGGTRAGARLTIVAGQTTRAELRFPGRLFIDGPPGAIVRIDDDERCLTPCAAELPSGRPYAVEVQAGDRLWRHAVSAAPGEALRLEPRFDDDAHWVWIGAGLGVAAVAGTVIGLLAAADAPQTLMHFTTFE